MRANRWRSAARHAAVFVVCLFAGSEIGGWFFGEVGGVFVGLFGLVFAWPALILAALYTEFVVNRPNQTKAAEEPEMERGAG